jgi:hypothetical protein
MKSTTLAALALIGASFAATPASAMPLNQGIAKYVPPSQVVQVDMRRDGMGLFGHRHRDNDFRFGLGLGFPLALGLGYDEGRPECIGRWYKYHGRWHCHGRLVWDY